MAIQNEIQIRNNWIKKTSLGIPNGSRILDAGAGQLRCET